MIARQRALFGSAGAALVLAGAVVALILPHGAISPNRPSNQSVAPAMQGPPADVSAIPNKPTLAPESPAIHPSFDIVKVGPSGTVVIAGRAEPGSRVTVRDGDTVIGQVTADGRGEWALVPEKPIPPGDRLLSLEAVSPQGGATVKSDETVALSVAPARTGKGGTTALAVVLPRDGGGGARVLQYPALGDAASSEMPGAGKPAPLTMETLEYDAKGRIVLSGRAPPKATVQIYLGNDAVATVTADDAGVWSAKSTRVARHRGLELRLDQLAEDGRVIQRVAVPFAGPTEVELAPGQEYIVQPGNNLWQIAQRAYGVGTRYLIIYSANLPRIKDPERIYPGQVFKLPKS